ncbi:hypothetical protein JCM10908_006805 [Rhodotorula pacifica]|uniref:uncharacterized protein n=1 Tax=Rhodotorula pacifica TaxID=1495444 RepID=UPI00317888E6
MVNPRVFHDYAVVGEHVQPLGRVIFELFADTVPKTAENFRALCTGSAGVNSIGIPLWYKGSPLHRVIAGFMVQGGDFTDRNGKGGESIYGTSFEDENLSREIDSEGLLCMANKGKNTNSSQFFVTLRPCPHLKGKHVVLGRVVKGFETIVAISKMAVDAKDRPIELITIQHCGELERKAAAKPPPPPSSSSSASVSSRSRSRSRSLSPDRSRSKRSRSSRHRSRHSDDDESGSEGSEDEEHRRRRHRSRSERDGEDRKNKRRHHRSSRSGKSKSEGKRARSPSASPELTPAQIEELERRAREEAELAARKAEVEAREAQERARKAKEERERYEQEQIARGGIIYKGSGRMKAGSGSGDRRGGMRGWQ